MMVEVLEIVSDEGTVVVGRGMTEDGVGIEFAGDRRAMWAIAQALDAGEVVETDVPDWAVLGYSAVLS